VKVSIRPEKPSIKELKAICQPPSVTGRSNAEHWVADLYLRKISPYLTRVLLKTPITANGVTYLMIATGLSISIALQIPGFLGLALALFLSQLQMLWDCCDGEIARWRQTQSPKGVFLDRVGHYLTESMIPIALAFRINSDDQQLHFLAALISVGILLNKGFNDAVHVARAFAGQSRLTDSPSVGTSRKSVIRVLRAPFKIIPIQRLFHSVEMTILIFIFMASEELIRFGLPAIIFVTIGHLIAILSSGKFEANPR
jgi:phosphatidylglycerophosphate synthase